MSSLISPRPITVFGNVPQEIRQIVDQKIFLAVLRAPTNQKTPEPMRIGKSLYFCASEIVGQFVADCSNSGLANRTDDETASRMLTEQCTRR